MNAETHPVIIVGAGLAGLACAGRLIERGVPPLLLEASDGVGGRVRTDVVDGYRLDRGFQVFLDAYPEASALLDLEALDLRPFRPGAIIFRGGKRHRLMDVFRCPGDAFETALQPIGTLWDKLLVGVLRTKAMLGLPSNTAGQTTEAFLKTFGFSDSMIDGFFRPFYGGIFLERDLRTSADMFDFTFRMFARGSATLPAAGMEAIPQQLADRLPEGTIRLDSPVESIAADSVTLKSGERLQAEHVIVATDAESAGRWLPELAKRTTGWRSVVGMYFSASASPLDEAIIALNGSPNALVNNVCVLSDAAPDYAPAGRSLISVSVLGEPDFEDLESRVRAELTDFFGETVAGWTHLRTDPIRLALPEQPPTEPSPTFQRIDDITVCGDHCSSASIEGAILSGIHAAESIPAR